jgi:hypothetical protein
MTPLQPVFILGMAAFSATAPVNPSERQSERLSPRQMRICSPPSIRHWIRQRKADQTGLSQFRQKATVQGLKRCFSWPAVLF